MKVSQHQIRTKIEKVTKGLSKSNAYIAVYNMYRDNYSKYKNSYSIFKEYLNKFNGYGEPEKAKKVKDFNTIKGWNG